MAGERLSDTSPTDRGEEAISRADWQETRKALITSYLIRKPWNILQ